MENLKEIDSFDQAMENLKEIDSFDQAAETRPRYFRTA